MNNLDLPILLMFQLNLRKEKGKEEMVQLPDRKHVKKTEQTSKQYRQLFQIKISQNVFKWRLNPFFFLSLSRSCWIFFVLVCVSVLSFIYYVPEYFLKLNYVLVSIAFLLIFGIVNKFINYTWVFLFVSLWVYV